MLAHARYLVREEAKIILISVSAVRTYANAIRFHASDHPFPTNSLAGKKSVGKFYS